MASMSKYLDIFIREAEDHLESLQRGLLLLENAPDDRALVHELLRNAHTVKGSARMMAFDDIAVIGHAMEDVLKEIELGHRQAEHACVEALLAGTDAIASLVGSLRDGSPGAIDTDLVVTHLREGRKPPAPSPAAAEPPPPAEEDGGRLSVRTSVETLDRLVNSIGELVVHNRHLEDRLARLRLVARRIAGTDAGTDLGRLCHELEEDLFFRSMQTEELQTLAMKLRTVPFHTVAEGFQRMVRDLAVGQGKEAELKVVGGNLEIDRVMLDYLKPSLLHILRNAVDHGLETPEERLARGKQPKGTIHLTLRHDGNGIRIEIRDDGRGLDAQGVRKSAIRKGIIPAEEAARLADEDALYLVFRAGFSTRDSVTELSGRGIGLDVVRRNIEAVKGNLQLRSVPGEGTELTLRLPLTLSVVEALLVRCGGYTYAAPLTYVQETLRIRPESVATAGGKEVVQLRGATLPVISLAGLLGSETSSVPLSPGGAPAVILRYQDQQAACIVDASLGTLEIVVKGLGRRFRNVGYVSGATILGDGDPALILNVPDIFQRLEAGTEASVAFVVAQEGPRAAILVVDDSITTRTMERGILITHGYEVDVAVSGEDALEKAAARTYDLVVADIEMPGIDGFELTRKLRESETYRDVPVIIVSSLSRDEDKRKALEAGAQRYIVKGSFDQGALLDAVEGLVG